MDNDINIKNKKIIVVILGIILCISIFSGNKLFNKKERIKNNNNVLQKEKNKKEQFAMYIKNEAGNYDKYDGKEFPEGYKINLEKSSCEDANGNIVSGSISVTNGKPTVTSNKTIYCTFYMDKKPASEEITDNPIPGVVESTGVAEDELAVRYYGTNPPNYICFGTSDKDTCINDTDKYMYRIIGVDKSGRFKLIKKEALNTAYYWHNVHNQDIKWNQSDLYKGLNGISGGTYSNLFIGNSYYVPKDWENKIETINWKYGDIYEAPNAHNATNVTAAGMVQKEQAWTTTVSAKIGLMYLADYYFGLSKTGTNCSYNSSSTYPTCKTSWMHLSKNDTSPQSANEYTMSYYGWYSNIYYGAWSVYSNGFVTTWNLNSTYSVRPVFYLKSNIEISGIGTQTDPFIITN